MAHFAKLNDDNIVVDVNVVSNAVLLDSNNIEREELGIQFLVEWSGGHTNWKQTSYNNNFRNQYASIGDLYLADVDKFVSPQPYASWTLDKSQGKWVSPTPRPSDENVYFWNEDQLAWQLVTA
jgi:hypothetical protein